MYISIKKKSIFILSSSSPGKSVWSAKCTFKTTFLVTWSDGFVRLLPKIDISKHFLFGYFDGKRCFFLMVLYKVSMFWVAYDKCYGPLTTLGFFWVDFSWMHILIKPFCSLCSHNECQHSSLKTTNKAFKMKAFENNHTAEVYDPWHIDFAFSVHG